MFERFTERARQVVVLAQEEARRLKHDWIGTEHILLGLLAEKEGLAARALEELGITAERIREQAVQILGLGEAPVVGQIAFTPRTQKVLELSLREALSLGHNYIGTEHLLLGLVRENGGVAVRILLDSDVDSEKVRTEVIRMLSGPGRRGWAVGTNRPCEHRVFPDSLVDGAGRLIETLAREIEKQLGRPADAGDLLVLLACVPDGLAARTLTGLHVDVDSLQRAAEEARRKGTRSGLLPPAELVAEIERVRNEKAAKIEAQSFEAAAERRDVERGLENDARRHEQQQTEDALTLIRSRLELTDGSTGQDDPKDVG